METQARIIDINRDYKTGKTRVSLEVETFPEMLEGYLNKALRLALTIWRGKRSRDANDYYWVLLSKLAEAVGLSKSEAHNLMLRRYGQVETVNGERVFMVLPDSPEAEEKAAKSDEYHIKPTSQFKVGTDGKTYRTWVLLRGSSTYDTKEMSVLIDGLVSECEQAGIETVPPEELERMKALYGKKHHSER